MSDDRLFASNSPIGRKWYAINLVILALITVGTKIIFEDHIIPYVTTDVYDIIAKGFLYMAYAFYVLTFLALVERRLYDVCGSREIKSYRNVLAILTLAVFLHVVRFYIQWQNPPMPIPPEIIDMATMLFSGIFLLITAVLTLLKGSISNLSYEEYRKKIKYE